MPLALAEQDISTEDYDEDASSSTTASPTTDDGTATDTTEKTALPQGSCRLLANDSEETGGLQESMLLLDTEHGKGVEAIGTGSSCAVIRCGRRRRIIAGRARICGILVEKGARRAWRRAPSGHQVELDKKYAALLEDDDGRNLCTFSG